MTAARFSSWAYLVRYAQPCALFLPAYSAHLLTRVVVEYPINLMVWQSSLYATAHDHSTVFQNFFFSFLAVFSFHLESTLEDVSSRYTINLLHRIFFCGVCQNSAYSWFYLIKHCIDVGLKLVIRIVVEDVIFHISVKQIVH